MGSLPQREAFGEVTEIPAPPPPVIPPQFVKGYARIAADGTILFDTGFIDKIDHDGPGVYLITVLAKFVDPDAGADVAIQELNASSIGAEVSDGGLHITVNTWSPGEGPADLTDRAFLIQLLSAL